MQRPSALYLLPVLGLTLCAPRARAELQVRMPTVDYREIEFEHNGLATFGRGGSAFDRARSYTNEIAVGVTPWWKIGLEVEMASGPGQSLRANALTFENTFQLTEPGAYAFDLGFFAEFSRTTARTDPNEVKFGPILQKELPNFLNLDTLHTLNVFFTREVGTNANRATGVQIGWQSVVRMHPLFSPGIEYYAEIEDLGRTGGYNRQRHMAGPVLTGAASLAPYGKLKYEIGYVFGMTTASPTGALRWKLEYEIPF